MTVTIHGLVCDGCGKFIGIADPEEVYYIFTLVEVEEILHCCLECHPVIMAASDAGDYTLLPDGPIKKFYEKMEDKS